MTNRLWSWLGRAADAHELVAPLAVPAAALAVGAATAAWGLLRSLSGPQVFSSSLLALAGSAWLGRQVRDQLPSWRLPRILRAEDRELLRVLFIRHADGASREARTVLANISEHLRGQALAHFHLGNVLRTYVERDVEQAAERCRQALEDRQRQDPQACLADLYQKYQVLALWLRDAGQAGGYPFERDGNFRLWKQHDTNFLAGLDELIARSAFKRLREAVVHHMWPQGGVRDYSEYRPL